MKKAYQNRNICGVYIFLKIAIISEVIGASMLKETNVFAKIVTGLIAAIGCGGLFYDSGAENHT